MKVEAEDAKNDLVCCATITEIKGSRMKIHFDGWSEGYDIWTKIGSPKVHYVGWCQETELPLCPQIVNLISEYAYGSFYLKK